MSATKRNLTRVGAALLAVALAASAGAASAADAAGKFAVRGVGAQTCERFTSFVGSSDANVRREAILLFDAWFSGYVSHVNRSAAETFDVSPLINTSDMLAVLLQQCRRNPAAIVESMAAGVLAALAPAKVAEESPVVTVGDGQRSRDYRRATIIRVQQKLIERGLLQGAADGVFGPATGSAVMEFQKAEGLEASGFLDADTVVRLLLK